MCLKRGNVCTCVWKAGQASESTYHYFHTLTSQPAPQEGFFPEPSSSPSSPSPWLPGNLERYRCPWARMATDRHTSSPTRFNNQIWQREEKGEAELPCQELLHNMKNFNNNLAHLQQAVTDQRHQEVVAPALAHHGGVFRSVHTGEVEHGHIRLPVVVDGKVQRGQLVVGGEIGSLTGIRQQCGLVHVSPGQQQLGVCIVLPDKRRYAMGIKIGGSSACL